MSEEKTSTFAKLTKVVIWIMLIVMVGAVLGSAVLSLLSF